MHLERCGDLAKNIAKRALVLAESEPLTPLTRSIERMGKLVAAPPEGRARRLHRRASSTRRSASGRATTRSTSTTTACSASC